MQYKKYGHNAITDLQKIDNLFQSVHDRQDDTARMLLENEDYIGNIKKKNLNLLSLNVPVNIQLAYPLDGWCMSCTEIKSKFIMDV